MNLIYLMKLVILLKLWPANEVDTLRTTRSEKVQPLRLFQFSIKLDRSAEPSVL